jgi:hypothetical protein
MANRIDHDPTGDGIDRRGFLKCMAWAGTGLLCTINGGILSSLGLSEAAAAMGKSVAGGLSFAQISDSHIGFNKAANKDVIGQWDHQPGDLRWPGLLAAATPQRLQWPR